MDCFSPAGNGPDLTRPEHPQLTVRLDELQAMPQADWPSAPWSS